MKILYLARFGNHDNCDEEAIAHALRVLGHEVVCVQEAVNQHPVGYNLKVEQADLCLFHKHEVYHEIELLSRNMPCVFWYFDMVQPVDKDPTLAQRSQYRVRWMNKVLPHVKLGFCTDGDWVENPTLDFSNVANRSKRRLRWLMQGADERFVGLGEPVVKDTPPILFTGMINHGRKRANQIHYLQERYKDQFQVIGNSGARQRVHGRELANLFASTKVVIAPCGPATDRYWSNRVYLTLGLGGLLLHPRCKGLETQYYDNELLTYVSQKNLDQIIDNTLSSSQEAVDNQRRIGLQATLKRNLYRHRCEELIRQVKEVL